MTPVVLDIAGAGMGGAASWVSELDAFTRSTPDRVRVIGRGRRLSPTWLLGREAAARGAVVVVAANNASFTRPGVQRRVLVRNALHFLYPWETAALDGMPRTFQLQIRLVRALVTRADLIVVPSTAMAERVAFHVPSARDRVTVRAHPVTPAGDRVPGGAPFLLVPVLPAPYKNLFPQLRMLVAALDRAGSPLPVRLATHAPGLPPELSDLAHRVVALGNLGRDELSDLWRRATAVFFPCVLESFGYPLAEARAYGVPVLSPDSGRAREIAGPALVPYDAFDAGSLAVALERLDAPVAPQPRAFDRDSYFRWLLGKERHVDVVPSRSEHKSGRDSLNAQ